MDLERVGRNLADVRDRIAAACARAGRPPESVTLIVVTKSVPVEAIAPLASLGVTDVAENRPIEGGLRLGELACFRRHMIGHLQTNKLNKALAWADVIHSVDRPSLVEALAKQPRRPPVFIEVNVSGEAAKGGFHPEAVPVVVAEARGSLEVLGLMTMPPAGVDARPYFRKLRELADRCGVAQLSMGMSQDFEIAVEEGATCVRVGTAVFAGAI